MGSLIGHVAPGSGFFLIGLWHLINHIITHALHPHTYSSLSWFPVPKLRYLELFLIMAGSTTSVTMELFVGPRRHQPLDPDGTIPYTHFHNFEHSNISMTFFLYAAFAIVLDKVRPRAQYGLTQLLGAVAFAQELFLFHLHSTDHAGVEGQYHLLLQIVISVSLISTLLGIGYPKSFLISFVRSLSILFQGVWFIVMGVMLWTPEFISKGCYMNLEEGRMIVRCRNHDALVRAKALVNIEFSWYVIGVTLFAMSLYLWLVKTYPEKVEYKALVNKFDEHEEELQLQADDNIDVEAATQKNKSYVQMGKLLSTTTPIHIEAKGEENIKLCLQMQI